MIDAGLIEVCNNSSLASIKSVYLTYMVDRQMHLNINAPELVPMPPFNGVGGTGDGTVLFSLPKKTGEIE